MLPAKSRDRYYKAGARPVGQRARPLNDGVFCGPCGRTERLGAGNLRSHDQIQRNGLGAVERVSAAGAQAQRLTEAAQSMSGIVDLINNITSQINLLALNATIESARAGEDARGFAVVASEVKSLANQAKSAADKIGEEIGSLNAISGDVAGALTVIKQTIQAVSEYLTSTAAAVEE